MAAVRVFSRLLQINDGFDAEVLKLTDHVVLQDVDRIRTRNRHNLV